VIQPRAQRPKVCRSRILFNRATTKQAFVAGRQNEIFSAEVGDRRRCIRVRPENDRTPERFKVNRLRRDWSGCDMAMSLQKEMRIATHRPMPGLSYSLRRPAGFSSSKIIVGRDMETGGTVRNGVVDGSDSIFSESHRYRVWAKAIAGTAVVEEVSTGGRP